MLGKQAIEMLIAARSHEERYLLPRRYSSSAELDALYEAARCLVDNGYARWLSSSSILYPGIILTDRGAPVRLEDLHFVDDVKPETAEDRG